jgi:very-short-patch-repair endonuclease
MKKGSKMTDEQKKKLSEAHTGQTAWNKGKKGLQIAWNKGKHHTEESRKKISSAHKGVSAGMSGKHHSEATKIKISESKKGQDFWTGRQHSAESKKKMSEAHKGKSAWWNKGRIRSKETINKQKISHRKTLSIPEVKARLKEAQKKAMSNPELRKRMSELKKEQYASGGIQTWNKGKPWSEEAREEMSRARKKGFEEGRIKTWNKGKPMSEEIKKEHSEFMKDYFRTHKHPMLGKKQSDASKRKSSESHKGKPSWNKGKEFPQIVEYSRQKMLKLYESGAFPKQQNTKPEREIKAELIKRGYKEGTDFIHQYKFMNKFMCDFCFPQKKLVIEVDGDFWHANPEKYPEGSILHKHQLKDIGRDKSKTAYITKVDNGSWTLLRLWESDIKKDVAKCVDKIEEILKKKK